MNEEIKELKREIQAKDEEIKRLHKIIEEIESECTATLETHDRFLNGEIIDGYNVDNLINAYANMGKQVGESFTDAIYEAAITTDIHRNEEEKEKLMKSKLWI